MQVINSLNEIVHQTKSQSNQSTKKTNLAKKTNKLWWQDLFCFPALRHACLYAYCSLNHWMKSNSILIIKEKVNEGTETKQGSKQGKVRKDQMSLKNWIKKSNRKSKTPTLLIDICVCGCLCVLACDNLYHYYQIQRKPVNSSATRSNHTTNDSESTYFILSDRQINHRLF